MKLSELKYRNIVQIHFFSDDINLTDISIEVWHLKYTMSFLSTVTQVKATNVVMNFMQKLSLVNNFSFQINLSLSCISEDESPLFMKVF